jgi:hypothetical protein
MRGYLGSVAGSAQRLLAQALVVEQGVGAQLSDYEAATPLEELVVNGCAPALGAGGACSGASSCCG